MSKNTERCNHVPKKAWLLKRKRYTIRSLCKGKRIWFREISRDEVECKKDSEGRREEVRYVGDYCSRDFVFASFDVNILCDFIRVCEKRVKGFYEGTKESSKNATGILWYCYISMYRFDSVCALSGWGQTGSDRHFNTDLSGIFIYFWMPLGW